MRNIILLLFIASITTVQASDWAQWRHDAQHSACSSDALPQDMKLLWSKKYEPRRQAWVSPLNQYLMQYDKQFEPVVMNGIMVIGFNDADKVIGIDVKTGKTIWSYFTDAPVRLAPALYDNKAYISCDDGFLHCVNISDGTIIWKFNAAPDKRNAIGNRRIISMWPVRGGAVIDEGKIYFSSGIWPFMGVFIYCLDAETGKQIWVNDYDCIKYRPQPHNATAFAGIAPQGVFAVSDNLLLIPGGRTIPGAYDKATGREVYYNFSKYSKNYGGDFVAVNGGTYYCRARNKHSEPIFQGWDNSTGKPLKKNVYHGSPAFSKDILVCAGKNIEGYSQSDNNKLWKTNLDAKDLIIANDTIYAGGRNYVAAIKLSSGEILWKDKTEGTVVRLLCASSRLFIVTQECRISCFGSKSVKPSTPAKSDYHPLQTSTKTQDPIIKLIKSAPLNMGYALVWGIENDSLIDAIATETKYSIVVVDSSLQKVNTLRERLNAAHIYGDKVSVHYAPENQYDIPPYTMSLVIENDKTNTNLWKTVHPYGGMMITDGKARIKSGALTGSAPWTHNYGSIAQTAKSNDKLVRMPMQPLWWGGEAPNTDVLPRHGHGPSEQVIGGRLFIQGTDCFSARDVYTGRLLWKKDIPGLNLIDIFYNKTYNSNPMAVGYNQVHIPGTEMRGGNFVATTNVVYLLKQKECLLLDTVTGETINTFKLPGNARWGYIGVENDILFAGSELDSHSLKHSTSKRLYALDRHTGKPIWKTTAEYGFLNNAICASKDTIFCIDRYPYTLERRLRNIGQEPQSHKHILHAFDIKTGKEIWSSKENIFGSFLAYSEKYNALIMSLRPTPDGAPQDKAHSQISVYDANTGAIRWNKTANYSTFPITHTDLLLTKSGAWRISDGSQLEIKDPVTDETNKWSGFEINKGCNYPIASEYMITYRSSTASFYNMLNFDGTGSFGGFKPGCTATLIAADGVINAPDYTFTCSCAFQTQSSLALVHASDVPYWTRYSQDIPNERLNHYAVNFGAPGDRIDGDTLWLNYPNVDSGSKFLKIETDKTPDWVTHNPFRFGTQKMRWVYSSCIEGADAITLEFNTATLKESSQYTVRLYFAEPSNIKLGDRKFDVALNGKKVLSEFDILNTCPTPRRGLFKEFQNITCATNLKIEFKQISKQYGPILSGIELIRE